MMTSQFRKFCLMCFAAIICLVSAPAFAQKRVALVIGNGGYKETTPLFNTVSDATAMSAALKRLGFDVLDGIDLDKREMERLIRQFDQKLPGTDIAVFFYAGHGMQVSGQNYLVPVDARLGAEGDIDFESLPVNLVLARMEREAKTTIVLLDACRDNPLVRNLARNMGTRAVSVGQGLAEIRTGVGTLIGFATQPGNVAIDGKGNHSPYTTALLKQIESPGRDIMATLAAVTGEVVTTTAGRQVPWQHASLTGPVILRPLVAPDATRATSLSVPPLLIPPAPAAAPAPSQQSAAAETWPLVKDSVSVPALEAYVRRYGDTFYGDLARERIANLQAQQRAVEAKQAEIKKADDAAKADAARTALQKAEQDQRQALLSVKPQPEPPKAAEAPPQATPLSPSPPQPVALTRPDDTSRLARFVQSELKRVGCDPGSVDGNWGTKSRSATVEFARRMRVSSLGDEPSDDLLDRLLNQRTRVCPLQCDDDEVESNGRCVARPSPPRREKAEPESKPRPREREQNERREVAKPQKQTQASQCAAYERCVASSGANATPENRKFSVIIGACGPKPLGC
jgi:hypothetical protein